MAGSDELRDLTARHFQALVSECPPDMILAATVVLAEGDAAFMVALNPAATVGGPTLESLRDGLVRVLQEYLDGCPNVVRARASSGDAPS